MKKLIVLFTCITLAAQAADEFREFTANDGRTLNARVLSYDSKNDAVEIQRDDLQILCVKSTVFSEADQAYVKQWASCSLFLSPLKFVIIPQRSAVKSSWSGAGGNEESPLVRVSEYQYEIAILNQTGLPMENLTMDYLIYYTYDGPASYVSTYPRESHIWTNRDGLQEKWSLVSASNAKVVIGTIPIRGLAAGGWENFITDRVTVLKQHSESLCREDRTGCAGSGILITISMATPDGGRVERSLSLPKNMDPDFSRNPTGASRNVVTFSSASKPNS